MTEPQWTVVVVDDNEIMLETVRAGLSPLGWRVVTFDNAFGVVTRIREANPDVILLDVNMPTLPGDKLVKSVTSVFGCPNARVLLHSDRPAGDLRKLVRESGAHGFIQKTDDAAALDRKLRQFLAPAP